MKRIVPAVISYERAALISLSLVETDTMINDVEQ